MGTKAASEVITKATGITNPDQLNDIENGIRDRVYNGTLCGLEAYQFAILATNVARELGYKKTKVQSNASKEGYTWNKLGWWEPSK